MKLFIMLGIMFVLVTVNVQASTIILKDGRSISGDIIQQDKTKVVVKDGDSSLTYYRDEIVSIDGEPLDVRDSNTVVDPEKEALLQQYIEIFNMHLLAERYAGIPPDKRQIVLTLLDNDKNISALEQIRKKALERYLSTSDLEAAVKFYSSAEGKKFNIASNQSQHYLISIGFYRKFVQEAQKVIESVKAK